MVLDRRTQPHRLQIFHPGPMDLQPRLKDGQGHHVLREQDYAPCRGVCSGLGPCAGFCTVGAATPKVAILSDASNRPESDTGHHLGLYVMSWNGLAKLLGFSASWRKISDGKSSH